MKQNIFLSLGILSIFLSCDPKGDQKETAFNCGHMIGYQERLSSDSIFSEGLQLLENQTNEYLDRLKEGGFTDFRSTVVTIPVVVHVVYENPTENISDAKIQSQIDALNNFFRRLNTDVSTVPAPFTSFSADILIEFELAKRDPNCLPTTGITRTPTTVTTFPYNPLASTAQSRNPVKFTTSGGANGWPPDQYLNIWVCDLGSVLIGYAAFPSDLASRPSEDGVVMHYQGFGTIPPVFSGLDLGRVCGHEVGHWLNLRHIWGDDCSSGSQCAGTDFVDDTPNQECSNSTCPPFPKTDACSPTSPGVMFMNQMDYTNDACRRMFTIGQSDRMAATLFTIRNSLLGSQGAIPPPLVTTDLWMKDTDDDLGNEPNNESSIFYLSDDIWVRNANNGLTNQESQNALGGGTNYVYVRVRNRGCSATAAGATLKLYWAKASSGLSWPAPWDGTITLSGALMGNPFVTQTIPSIPSNSSSIFTFTWTGTPDPSDYAVLGSDLNHFCLLARIEESGGMAVTEVVGDLFNNVKNNNNIVWKNIAIDDTDGTGFVSALVSNYDTEKKLYKITIDGRITNQNLFGLKGSPPGELFAKFDNKLSELIESNRVKIKGLEKTNDGHYILRDHFAEITGLSVLTKGYHIVSLQFVPNPDFIFKRFAYDVLVNQSDENSGNLVGGQLFRFKSNSH